MLLLWVEVRPPLPKPYFWFLTPAPQNATSCEIRLLHTWQDEVPKAGCSPTGLVSLERGEFRHRHSHMEKAGVIPLWAKRTPRLLSKHQGGERGPEQTPLPAAGGQPCRRLDLQPQDCEKTHFSCRGLCSAVPAHGSLGNQGRWLSVL